ncbi:hypothetical protein GGX14DRAFT_394298 [Mycena pura]|uniref:Uncharacterized protein n=1 Tax=Mycena pura TaxID=153505 RepID=A0AAD6YG13_9AGAR|nr:hypothetical protein GGX14DRAFT_394298 [Mycena pura]
MYGWSASTQDREHARAVVWKREEHAVTPNKRSAVAKRSDEDGSRVGHESREGGVGEDHRCAKGRSALCKSSRGGTALLRRVSAVALEEEEGTAVLRRVSAVALEEEGIVAQEEGAVARGGAPSQLVLLLPEEEGAVARRMGAAHLEEKGAVAQRRRSAVALVKRNHAVIKSSNAEGAVERRRAPLREGEALLRADKGAVVRRGRGRIPASPATALKQAPNDARGPKLHEERAPSRKEERTTVQQTQRLRSGSSKPRAPIGEHLFPAGYHGAHSRARRAMVPRQCVHRQIRKTVEMGVCTRNEAVRRTAKEREHIVVKIVTAKEMAEVRMMDSEENGSSKLRLGVARGSAASAAMSIYENDNSGTRELARVPKSDETVTKCRDTVRLDVQRDACAHRDTRDRAHRQADVDAWRDVLARIRGPQIHLDRIWTSVRSEETIEALSRLRQGIPSPDVETRVKNGKQMSLRSEKTFEAEAGHCVACMRESGRGARESKAQNRREVRSGRNGLREDAPEWDRRLVPECKYHSTEQPTYPCRRATSGGGVDATRRSKKNACRDEGRRE